MIRREERISRQQEARRRDILAVARDLLSRDGISRFHMERVAEEGGYSRTSIYRYFSSKEDLVMDLAIESVVLRVGLYRRVQAWSARARERVIEPPVQAIETTADASTTANMRTVASHRPAVTKAGGATSAGRRR